MPMLANNVGDGLSLMLSAAVPGSVTAANSLGNAFGFGKQSMETAMAIEKVASKINGKEWHELSALLNMKYRLDKVAEEIATGHYLYNAEPVFEKVAELISIENNYFGLPAISLNLNSLSKLFTNWMN
jgi:hypothetical protein